VVRVVDARTGSDPAGVGGPISIEAAALSPDGRLVATASLGWVALWDAATGALVRSWRLDEVDALRFAAGGAWLFGYADGGLLGVPVGGGDPVRYPLPDGCGGERGQPLPGGDAWLLECDDGLAVWRPGEPEPRRRVRLASAEAVHAIAVDADGRRAVVVSNEMAHGDMPSDDMRIEVIDLATWKVGAHRVPMRAQSVVAALLPDGRVVLDQTLFDPATGKTAALGADILVMADDRRAALMMRVDAPYGRFVWLVDQPLRVPAAGTLLDTAMSAAALSATGRLLECDGRSLCQVRELDGR
jgi:hypothetical protein